MWRARNPDPEQVRLLQQCRERYDLKPLVVHGSYLMNLASAEPELRRKSVEAFAGEIERASFIGAEYLVIHPGNYKNLALEQGLINAAEGMIAAWNKAQQTLKQSPPLTLLVENTAGGRNQLGGSLQELATLRQLVISCTDLRLGFCLDTCHLFVNGYNISTAAGLKATLDEAERTVGLARVPVIHVNDAKAALGSHLDRHQNIGGGYIGRRGFRRILQHPQLRGKAFILETPIDTPGDDLRNVTVVKELAQFPNKRLTTRESKRSGTSGGRTTRRST